MPRRTRSTVVALLALLGGILASLPVSPATAATPVARSGADVVTRRVLVAVENTNATPVACTPDNKSYVLHARLVGPRHEVLGANVPRMDVLVHDLATGSWFWNLRRHPAYDYATRLAHAGETSLVLDRLGYGASKLAQGNATCLGAQADMLHQVVQHVRSGQYRFADSARSTPAGVQRTALARRDVDPCGDALSLGQMVTASTSSARNVEAPVLLLFGGK